MIHEFVSYACIYQGKIMISANRDGSWAAKVLDAKGTLLGQGDFKLEDFAGFLKGQKGGCSI